MSGIDGNLDEKVSAEQVHTVDDIKSEKVAEDENNKQKLVGKKGSTKINRKRNHDEEEDDKEEEDEEEEAPKKKRATKSLKLPPSVHAGPSTFDVGFYQPASSMEELLASLPPKQGSIKILCWNVNGFRAAVNTEDKRKDLLRYVEKEDPAIILFQEIKINEKVAKESFKNLFPAYKHAYFSCSDQRSGGYAGVALYSREPCISYIADLGGKHDKGRVQIAKYPFGIVVNAYTPNSGRKLERLEYRTKEWDVAFREKMQQLLTECNSEKKPLIIMGDLNVAFHDCDIHNPVSNRNKTAGFCDSERDGFQELLETGLVDIWRKRNPTLQQFTYWSPRFNCRASNRGWRLDYALISKNFEDKVVATEVRHAMPGKFDHVPIVLELNL